VKFVTIGDVNKLLKKELAYFCCFFLYGFQLHKLCEFAWTKGWYVELLNSKNTSFVHYAIEVVTYEDVKWDQLGGCND
jgi:hypothetical protein